MLVAAAVCPHPPLIVPELAGAAAAELDDLRTACASAIRSLAGARPDLLVVAGGARASATYPGDAAGTLKPWGLDVRAGEGEPSLPLSLTIGRWLLERALPGLPLPGSPFAGPPVSGVPHGPESGPESGPGFDPGSWAGFTLRFEAVATDASPGACAALGRRLAGSAPRVALLVMADGSARLTEKSPGYVHPAAVPSQETLVRALTEGGVDRLAGLDPAEAAELWVAGRAAFQVLAAAADAPPDVAELLYGDAPYGVGYAVARWLWHR